MEDLDVRIFNLSSKLAIDPQEDPNNREYVSFLPPSNTNISPVSSPVDRRPHTPSQIDSPRQHPPSQQQQHQHQQTRPPSRTSSGSSRPLTALNGQDHPASKRNNPSSSSSSSSSSSRRSESPAPAPSKKLSDNHPDRSRTSATARSRSPSGGSQQTQARSGGTSFLKFFKAASSNVPPPSPSSNAHKEPKDRLAISKHSSTDESFKDTKENSLAKSSHQMISRSSREPKVLLQPSRHKSKPSNKSSNTTPAPSSSTPSHNANTDSPSSKSAAIFSLTKQRNTLASPLLTPVSRPSNPASKSSSFSSQRDRDEPIITKKDAPIKSTSSLNTMSSREKHTHQSEVTTKSKKPPAALVITSPPLTISTSINTKEMSAPNSPLILPPMLSPTLPEWCDELIRNPPISRRQLSPTIEEVSSSSSSSSSNKSTEGRKTTTGTKTRREAKKSRLSNYDDDSDGEMEDEFHPVFDSTSSRSPSPAIGSEPKHARRNSLIVSLKLNSKDRNHANKDDSTTKKQQPPQLVVSKKRPTNESTDSSAPSKKVRISRDYSDSESDDVPSKKTIPKRNKAPVKMSPTSTPANNNTKKNSNNNNPLESPINIARVPAPSVGSTASPEQYMNPGDTQSAMESTPLGSMRPSVSMSQEQRMGNYQLLMHKANRWRMLARERKHQADSLHQQHEHKMSAVYAMDSLLGYIVAFDYQDKADQMNRKMRQTQDWSSLIPFVKWLVTVLEEGDSRNLIGMCYQIRAMIHLRVGQCYHDLILRLKNTPVASAGSPESNGNNSIVGTGSSAHFVDDKNKIRDLETLMSKYFKEQQEAVTDFKRGLRDLGVDTVRDAFPKTWEARDSSVQPQPRHSGGFRPMEDPFFLPLHMFSSMQEATALGYRILKEWAERNDVDYESVLAEGLQGSAAAQ